MKNLKKLVSVMVTVAMLISSLAAVSVSADYNDVDTTNSYYKAIKVLSGLGIVKGDDEGNFNPTNDIKRSEAVALVCRMVGEDALATAAADAGFDDVPADHWAAGYIAWGVASEVVKGVGDNKFDPDAPVKFQDIIVMISRVTGYERIANRATYGGYPTGYLKVASQYGLLDNGIAGYAGAKAATREVVAQALYNGLTMPLVQYTNYGENPEDDRYVVYDGAATVDYRSTLTYTGKVFKVKAVVNETAISDPTLATSKGDMVNLLTYDIYDVGTVPTDIVNAAGVDVYVGESDVADFHKYTVEAYIAWNDDLNDYELLVAVPDSRSVDTVEISAVENKIMSYDASADEFTYRATKKTTKDIVLDVASAPVVYYNGRVLGAYTALQTLYSDASLDLEKLLEAYADKITFVDNDDNDIYETIFVVDYAYAQVSEVVADDLYIELDSSTFFAATLDVDPENRADEKLVCNIYDAEGKKIELADIAEDDILNIVAPLYNDAATTGYDLDSIDYMDIYVTSNVVTGVVDEDHGDGTYTIAGNVFGALNPSVATVLSSFPEGTFYVTIDGKVYDTEAESVISKNFALILGHEVATKFGVSVAEIQAFTAEGETATFTVASEVKVDGVKYKRSDDTQATVFGTQALPGGTIAAKYANAASTSDADINANLRGRLFSYKTNAAGELTEITFSTATAGDPFVNAYFEGDYKANTEVFAGNDAVADAVIIEAPYAGTAIDTDKLGLTTFGALVKDTNYKLNYYILNDDGEIAIASFAGEVTSATGGSHLAVVTGVSTVYDAVNDANVAKYTFIQSGEEMTAKVAYDATAVDALELGDVFRYGVDAEGNIDATELVYDYDADIVVGNYSAISNAEESSFIGTVTDVGTTTSGKRYAVIGGARVLYADVEGATFVSIDTTEIATAKDAAIKVIAGPAAIRKTTAVSTYSVLALCDEDGLIIDAVMFIR